MEDRISTVKSGKGVDQLALIAGGWVWATYPFIKVYAESDFLGATSGSTGMIAAAHPNIFEFT